MSQEDVLTLLRRLGNKATMKQLRALAKKTWPRSTLYLYLGTRLRQLEKWEKVTKANVGGEVYWVIKDGAR